MNHRFNMAKKKAGQCEKRRPRLPIMSESNWRRKALYCWLSSLLQTKF